MKQNYEKDIDYIINYKKSVKNRLDYIEKNKKNIIKENNISKEDLSNKYNSLLWKKRNNSQISYDKLLNMYKYSNSIHEYMYYGDYYNLEESSIKLSSGKVEVNFIAEATLSLELHIVGYKNEEKVFHKVVLPNIKEILKIEEGIMVRVGIRVKGKGYFKVEKITIGDKYLWVNSNFLNGNIVDKIGEIDANEKETNDIFKENSKFKLNDKLNFVVSDFQNKQFEYVKYLEKNIDLECEKYINVSLKAFKSEDVDLSAVFLMKSGKEIVNVVEVTYDSPGIIKLGKNISILEVYIKVRGTGYIKNVNLDMEEVFYNPDKSINLNLDEKLFFNNFKKEIKLSGRDKLFGTVNIIDGNKRYISYVEKNNNFSILPKTKIIDIDDSKIYRFISNLKSDEYLQVAIMLIFYSNNEKLQVIQLRNNMEEIIVPPKGANRIRIALRISGSGEFTLDGIVINEYKKINTLNNVEWIDKFDLNKLGVSKKINIGELKMAVIMDEFTTACYEDECTLIKLTPSSWKEQLIEENPDLLFVESAWKGNGGVWFKKIGDYGEENNREINEIVKWCKLNNIPTIFWNKEDPVHFDRFINTAKNFDYIFTTDINSVPNYKAITGEDNAYALPFAAQPKKHNPIKLESERLNKACFAGSYYKLHEERRIDMERVLDEVAEYGLDIYDRNYEAVKKGLMPNHTFPERFSNNIKGNLKYYEIDKAYKGYKLIVNVNTVKYSPTMFSRRVFEGLACGTPVISSYSEGVESMFKDIVYITKEEGDLKNIIPKLLNDEDYYNRVSKIGMREVFNKHTYTDRLAYILDKIGIRYEKRANTVTLLAIAKSDEEYEKILKIYNNQNYENKRLVILIDKFDGYIRRFKKYNTKDITTFILSYMHNYNNIMEIVKSDYVAFINTNDYYGENYISDLVMCTKYTDADVIGKGCYYLMENNQVKMINKNKDYEFVYEMNSTACICKTEIFKFENILDVLKSYMEIDFSKYTRRGIRLYSSDYLNYIKNYSDSNVGRKLKETIEL